MTPKQKRNVTTAGIGLLALTIVLGWAIPRGADASIRAIDTRYVLTDTFRLFQQGLRETRITDSASLAGDFKEVRRMLAGLDSSDRCRRGQRGFCR